MVDTSVPRARTLRDALESGGTQPANISRSTIARSRCRACVGSGENATVNQEKTLRQENCALLTLDSHINVLRFSRGAQVPGFLPWRRPPSAANACWAVLPDRPRLQYPDRLIIVSA